MQSLRRLGRKDGGPGTEATADQPQNSVEDIMISYDFQAGTYIRGYEQDPAYLERYTDEIALVFDQLGPVGTLLEAGCGEATTLSVLGAKLAGRPALGGFDISWSRVKLGSQFAARRGLSPALFCADLFRIPLADRSVDVVYTSHSVEPNGGREREAIIELARVARKWLVLLEPAHDLATEEARRRMEGHGYVRESPEPDRSVPGADRLDGWRSSRLPLSVPDFRHDPRAGRRRLLLHGQLPGLSCARRHPLPAREQRHPGDQVPFRNCGTLTLSTMSEKRAPNVLFVGFRRPLNQQAVHQALAGSRVGRLGLISRRNFLGSQADYFLTTRRGFRGCTFEANPFAAFPSASFVRNQQPSEVMVLRMFERIYRGLSSGQSYEVRKRLYLQQLAWAYGLIEDLNIDTIIFSDVPHSPFAYILYSVARALGRKTFFFLQLQVKDSYVIASSIETAFDPLRAEYQRLDTAGGPVTLRGRAQREFDRRSGKQKPFYMHMDGQSWWARTREWAKWTFRIDTRLRVHRTLRNGLAYWWARKALPSPGTNFVYFPLHLQPEAQTSPMGGVFVDQYLAVEMLARALPPGWVLVIKEHPVQRMAKRDYGFYARLGRIGNVRLVSRSTGTFTLTEQCRAVASITGTAGWEALFMAKPVLVFGNAFYRGAPGTVSIDDPRDLAAQLREIEQGRFPVCTSAELERFVCAVEHCTEEGIVDKVYLRDSDLSEQQSIDNYAAALIRLIERPETFKS
jgi:hypothetical protein